MRVERTRVKPAVTQENETITVTSSYNKQDHRHRQETLSVRKFLVEPAYVRVASGVTKNMGDFESLRVDVAITMPCYTEEIDEAIPYIADKVSVFLEQEIKTYQGE